MKDITEELSERGCVMCMSCGRIYEATIEEYTRNEGCVCGNTWLNHVAGHMDSDFWGSPAAKALYERKNMKEEMNALG